MSPTETIHPAPPRKVLMLCTGNSCRSQMAEAIVNGKAGSAWIASSAGLKPAGFVHPRALEVLQEIGLGQPSPSKHIDDLEHQDFDLVITLCDEADQNFPASLAGIKHLHLGLPDPAGAVGSQDEILKAFRIIRDELEGQLASLLELES